GHADGPLLARLQQAGHQLLPLEALAGAVFLDDHVGDLVDPLVAREAAMAFLVEALPPTPDHVALTALAGVHDLVAEMSAVRALHAPASISTGSRVICFIPFTLSPSRAAK